MNYKRIILKSAPILLGMLLIYGFAVVIFVIQTPVDMDNWFRPKVYEPFSEKKWQSTQFGDQSRYKMANDLVRSRQLIGNDMAKVLELLGTPSSEDTLGAEVLIGYDLVRQHDFPARCLLLPRFLFMNMDTWLLEIQCTEGKVKTVRIRFT